MRVPHRRNEKRPEPQDPYLTADKYQELQEKLDRWRASRPRLAEEVKRLAEMGDFSENAGYQLAKGRLRGLNQRIIDLENHLKLAVIIQPDKAADKIQIGSRVTLEKAGRKKEYTILGSTESNPEKGIISHLSPLGVKLIGHQNEDIINLEVRGKIIKYKIIKIN